MIFLIFPVIAFLCGASSGLITRHYRLWKGRLVEDRSDSQLACESSLVSQRDSDMMLIQPKSDGHVLLDWAMALVGGCVQLCIWFYATVINLGVASAGDRMSAGIQGPLFWLIAAVAFGLVPLIVWIVVLVLKRKQHR